MNRKKVIIIFLILITLIVMGVIFFTKPTHVPVLTTETVLDSQPVLNVSSEQSKSSEVAALVIDAQSEQKKSDELPVVIKQFRHVLPKISDIKNKKFDTHRPGLILYEMVDQLSELEDIIRDKSKSNDMKTVEQIVAVYAECAKDKQYYLPARALCLERIQAHGEQYKIPYNPKDYPIDVRSLLSTPDKL